MQPRRALARRSSLAAVEEPAQQAVVLVAHLAHAPHHAAERHADQDQRVRGEHQAGLERLGHHLGGARRGEPLEVGLVARAHDHRHRRVERVDVREHAQRRVRRRRR